MGEKNKKNIFIIIIILSIITIIVLGTYALSIWRSEEDTELTMRIGTISEVYFEEGNDVNVKGIGPIFDYEKDGIIIPFKVKNLTTNEVSVNINLNITKITEELIHKSFKYVLMASETGTDYEKVSEGSFVDTIDNSVLNIITGYELTTEAYFKVIFHIDGNMNNPIKMQNGSLEGYINAEAFLSGVLEEAGEVTSEKDYFLSTKIPRNQIESIDFISFEDAPENSGREYDVSSAQNRSVLLYYTDNDSDNLYEVMLGTETGTTIASSGAYLFSYLTNLININLTNLDTAMVTSMVQMFYGDISLEKIDVSNFDTTNVTSMYGMFCGIAENDRHIGMALKEIIGLTNFDTKNVTNMRSMFQYCVNLTTLDLSNFDTKNVINMRGMFLGSSVQELQMSLTSIKFSKKFDTKNVTNMRSMFQSCVNLTTLDLSDFDTSNVTDMSYMFSECIGLKYLDLRNFNTSSVKNMRYMFGSSYIANGGAGPMALEKIDGIEKFNTSNVTDMSGMFAHCNNLTELDVSNFNTTNVENMEFMFMSCYKLTSLNVSNFDTSNVKKMNHMFYACKSLTRLDLTNFNTKKVENMASMFLECSSLKSLDLSSFNTSKVYTMTYMFHNCTNLETILVDSFDVSSLTASENMFTNCNNLRGGAGTTYTIAQVNDASYAKIDGGTNAPGYFTFKTT